MATPPYCATNTKSSASTPTRQCLQSLKHRGGTGKTSLADLVNALDTPRTVWVMVPAGDITQSTVDELSEHMSPRRHTYRRRQLQLQRINPTRKRISRKRHRHAGQRHQRRQYGDSKTDTALTIGGNRKAYERNLPIFKTLAPPESDGKPLRRAQRLRTLRQDDPQRHRIRNDAGLCRRTRTPRSKVRLQLRPGRNLRKLALRKRHPLMAPRPHR